MSTDSAYPTYVFVTGSRRAGDLMGATGLIHQALSPYVADRVYLVHGECRGADTIAAMAYNWRGSIGIPARFPHLGKRAGPERNLLLVRFAVMLRNANYSVEWIAFPCSESRGTWDCVKSARAFGFKPTIHPLDPDVVDPTVSPQQGMFE
jgi:hypothetical protein